jgi:hypothetical protein
MPDGPRVRHMQHHAKPLGASLQQPGAGLNKNPRTKKRAQAIAAKRHRLKTTVVGGTVERPLVDATCSGCRWKWRAAPSAKVAEAHRQHVQQAVQRLRRLPKRNPRTQAL